MEDEKKERDTLRGTTETKILLTSVSKRMAKADLRAVVLMLVTLGELTVKVREIESLISGVGVTVGVVVGLLVGVVVGDGVVVGLPVALKVIAIITFLTSSVTNKHSTPPHLDHPRPNQE